MDRTPPAAEGVVLQRGPGPAAADPDVETPADLCAPPRSGVRLRGRIRSVARGREDATLTDAEWDAMTTGDTE